MNDGAQNLKTAKNKSIGYVGSGYLTERERQEFIRSFKRANQDEELKNLAEQGLVDYLNHLES